MYAYVPADSGTSCTIDRNKSIGAVTYSGITGTYWQILIHADV